MTQVKCLLDVGQVDYKRRQEIVFGVRSGLRHPRQLTAHAIASETFSTVTYVLVAARAVQRRRPRIAAGRALSAAGSLARLRAASAEPLQ